jgi:hypothetical protein
MSKKTIRFNYIDSNQNDPHPISVEVQSASKGPVQVNSLY